MHRTRGVSTGGMILAACLLTTVASFSGWALDDPEREALARSVESVIVIEMPARAAQLVSVASAQERAEVAAVAVSAVVKEHPAAAVPCVLAVLRVAPEVTESLIAVVLNAAPDCAMSLVSAGAERDDEQGDRMVAAVARVFPTRVGLFEREVAVVRARRATDSHGLLPRSPAEPSRTSRPAPGTDTPVTSGGQGVPP